MLHFRNNDEVEDITLYDDTVYPPVWDHLGVREDGVTKHASLSSYSSDKNLTDMVVRYNGFTQYVYSEITNHIWTYIYDFDGSTAHERECRLSRFMINGEGVLEEGTVVESQSRSTKTARLSNGNFVVVYTIGNGGPGAFTIFDPDGNVVVSETQFEDQDMYYPLVRAFSDGRFIIAGYDVGASNENFFIIYDNDGSVVSAKSEIYDYGGSYMVSLGIGTYEDKVVMWHAGTSQPPNTFQMHNSSGTQLLSPMSSTFNIAGGFYPGFLANGYIILFNDHSDGEFAVYDQSGNLKQDETTFRNDNGGSIHIYKVDTLPGGGVAVAGVSTSPSNSFMYIFNEDRSERANVELSGNDYLASLCVVSNDEIVFIRRNPTDSHFYFSLYDSDGETRVDELDIGAYDD